MNYQQILQCHSHRPWPFPQSPWNFYQEWNRTVFLHWKVDALILSKFLPTDLEIDLFQGQAWVSVVAFTMEKIRPRYLPYIPWISNFDEINIRTYVKKEGKVGVHFLNIEAGNRLSAVISNGISQLPYRYSKMQRTDFAFHAENKVFGDLFDIQYHIGDQLVNKSPIDEWLTERYALFQHTEKKMNTFEIHHLPWSIYHLSIKKLDIQYSRFAGLIAGEPDLFHYSPGVQVLAWGKKSASRKR